ncbi:hypothetical protein DFJ73DRAFT_643798 [Zopfochytrium polystomum]|nr:hypothetical protein DFJ73DRAFT_643798 [Zopfochytrium polystomum]
MSLLLAQLQSKQLRATGGPARDSSAPKLAAPMDAAVLPTHDLDRAVLACNIEHWLDRLLLPVPPPPTAGPITFRTVLVPITPSHARQLIACYEAFQRANCDAKDPAFVAQLDALCDALAAPLDAAVAALAPTGGGRCFAKMSSRSAKDAAPLADRARFRAMYKDALEDVVREGVAAPSAAATAASENERIWAILRAGTQALSYANGREMLRAFSTSERIWQDLVLALRHPTTWREHVAVREWAGGSQAADVDMEFRLFVHGGALTAACQYNYNVHSRRLARADVRARVAGLLRAFYEEEVAPRLAASGGVDDRGFADCVLDVLVLGYGERETERCVVVEVNPFLPSTDAALFEWDRERELLENGPFELRVVDRPRRGASAQFAKEWRRVLDGEDEPVGA